MRAHLIASGVINTCFTVILCMGFNFTYMMKFPNFAYATPAKAP